LGADLDLLKRWIAKCEHEHDSSDTCDLIHQESHTWRPGSHGFRVIDLEQSCAITVSGRVRYVALSYVWGKVEQLQAVLANENELAQIGSLLQEKHAGYPLRLENKWLELIIHKRYPKPYLGTPR